MRCLGLFAAVLIGLAGTSYSAPSATAIVESHLDGSTIISAKAAKLAPALHASVSETEKQAPNYVYAILAGGRTDANALAPSMVTTAINSLSTPKSSLLIGQIIEAAVKATPDMVLKIVHAAVLCSPDEAAPSIVRAALLSLPDQNHLPEPASDTLKSFKEYKDFKQVASSPDNLTPAERIVQEALAANPNLDPNVLTTSISTPPDNPSHFAIWPPIIPVVSK